MGKALGLSYDAMRERRKEQHFKKDLKKYGITPNQFRELFSLQQCLCAICGSDSPQGRGWCVDHDHTTGKVRGILCGKCNLGLGQLGDSVEALRKAYEYLVRSTPNA